MKEANASTWASNFEARKVKPPAKRKGKKRKEKQTSY